MIVTLKKPIEATHFSRYQPEINRLAISLNPKMAEFSHNPNIFQVSTMIVSVRE